MFLWATCSSCQPVKTLKKIQSSGPKQEKSPNGLVLSCGQMSDKSECQEHARKAVVACMKKIFHIFQWLCTVVNHMGSEKKFVTRGYVIKCLTQLSVKHGFVFILSLHLLPIG